MSLHLLLLAATLAASPAAPQTQAAPEPGQCTAGAEARAGTQAAAGAAQAAGVDADASGPAPAYDDQTEKAGLEYIALLTGQLSKSSDARDRALGTAMALFSAKDEVERSKNEAILRQAAGASPDDSYLQSLAAGFASEHCALPAECLRLKESPARLHPDDGLAWLAAMEFGGDEDRNAELLGRAAAATRFDDHFAEQFASMLSATRAQPPPPELFTRAGLHGDQMTQQGTMLAAASAFSSMPILPTTMSASFLCMSFGKREAPPQRTESCARLGRSMMLHGTSLAVQEVGYRLIGKALRSPADEAEKRTIRWRQHSLEELAKSFSRTDVDRYLADVSATGSEARAIELLMQRNGVALEPASSWAPETNEE